VTRIALAPLDAHETAAAFKRSGYALETLQGQLRRQWAVLDARWQGSSKGRVEGEVYIVLTRLTRLIEQTRDLGLTLDAISERFERADEQTAFVVQPIAWSSLPTITQHGPVDNEAASG
jgi:WXG100 family type VII secretion target